MIPLLFPLLAVVAGILSSAHLDPASVWLCLPLAVLLGMARKPCGLIALFLLGAGLRSIERPVPVLPAGPEASRVIATVLRRPEWRGIGVYLDVGIESIDGRLLSGRARLTEFLDAPELLDLFTALDLHSGDRVEIVVRLRRPARYRNPGVFDYRKYLERQGIFWTGTIRNPRLITVLQRGPRVARAGDQFKQALEERLVRFSGTDRDTRGLVLGMVLGRKQNLTPAVERAFQAGGLYHLVVVSGFNLAVVAGVAAVVARYLLRRRGLRLAAVACSVCGYALVVGGEPPVVRATLMVFTLIAARLLDRDYSPLNAIALCGLVLLLFDPLSLEDSSFQMTFVAVTAVAGIGMPAARWLLNDLQEKLRDFDNVERDGFLTPEVADWRVARRMFCELYRLPHAAITLPWRLYQAAIEGLIVSVAVEIVFVVFMVESFHRVSPVSPLLNVPAGLIAAAVTPLGLLLIILPDAIGVPVARVIGGMVHILLALLQWTLALPFSSLRVPSVPVWLWIGYGIAASLAIWGIRQARRWAATAGILAVLGTQIAIVTLDLSPSPPGVMTVTFLDVGQGDSALMEFPDGRRILIDGGGVAAGRFLGLQDESTFSIGENVVSAYLFARGIRRLDAVVLTHAHNDHVDGLFDVLNNFRVGELWLGKNPPIAAYRALLDTARRRNVGLRWLAAGDRLPNISVLHPPERWRVKKTADNNDSLVLLVQAGGQTALFTGDLELPLTGVGFVNLLKVSHHGSKGVRMQVQSDIRVISVGASNPFGHPHPSSLPALRTDLLGGIEVRLEGEHPVVRFGE
jgi:competence protein ComEC